jgi:hypothetical protein
MRFYIHKETGEPMGLIDSTMIELVGDKQSIEYPQQSEERRTIYLVVFPNRTLGNGIKFHSITHGTLGNFKRINKTLFGELCQDFGQYRHKNDDGRNISMFLNNVMDVKNTVKTFGY